MTTDLAILVDGLSFPESPRWHDGRLFISDMGTRQVLSVDVSTGIVRTEVERVPGAPSGLTWDDDGRMLIVSMARSLVYRDDGDDQLTEWVNLRGFGGGWRNDAVRHPDGWLYVGGVGGDNDLADLVMIDPTGNTTVAAEGLNSPNGMVITPDGRTLVVDEHHAGRLTAFSIAPDGTLSNDRTWAAAPDWLPDGCCLDADGAIWVASAGDPELRRIADGGQVLATVTASQPAYACMLGGPDRSTLFICTAPGGDDEGRARMQGRIEATGVEVPGAGWP